MMLDPRDSIAADRCSLRIVAESNSRRELVMQCTVAVLGGAVSLTGPYAGAAATALSPALAAGLSHIAEMLGQRRWSHAAETLQAAADDAGAESDEDFLRFVEKALSDERRQELLARALLIAQDTAMRDKRRALGRALASGVADNGTRVDDELLFIRVIDDLDAPHIRLLRIMTETPEHLVQYKNVKFWTPDSIKQADPGIGESVYALLLPLERHALVWVNGYEYAISPYGEWFLERLAEPTSE